MTSSSSLKDYLKRYESNTTEDKDKKLKKKKKSKNKKPRTEATGVLIVDEDPVWQKPLILFNEEEEDNESPDEKPQVNEDIEVKRMKRLEELRAKRPYHAISEDGSGWVSLSHNALNSDAIDSSPPRQHRRRYDSQSPEPPLEAKAADSDLSPPRMSQGTRHDSDSDLSPPRMSKGTRHDSVSPGRKPRLVDPPADTDLSPPRQRGRRRDSDSRKDAATSPPSRSRRRYDSPSSDRDGKMSNVNDQSVDISPPRRPQRRKTVDAENLDGSDFEDLSPPRRERHDSPIVRKTHGSGNVDLSPPRKRKEQDKTGLITGKEIKEEILRKKHEELSKFKLMDPSVTGHGAETVYRDRKKGVRISKDEYDKSQKKEEKRKEEKKLEWGKGLAQKRESEAKLLELEVEKDKPFARSRDDPDLDRSLKDAMRWGDPMAHLVKRKQSASVLPDLGDDERMQESGFIIPQEIPVHSWIKRGLEAAPNRYGIKPGRHWDGVDRSNGYEKELFKRMNNKQATEREAYLWSVSDM